MSAPIVINNPRDMREWTFQQRCAGQTVGLVPTMGGLHEGHASLMRESAGRDDASVLSVFVNPAQFAPHEDFDQYPRTFDADLALAERIGMDAVYAPTSSTMYADDYSAYVKVEGLQEGLCGGSRPHFFRGVATVVTKLFNAVLPHRAYFGQKDAQQCAVIKRMVRDLDFGIEIVELPIVRDADGLALSSRNQYLSPEERQRALSLPRALSLGLDLMQNGEREIHRIDSAVRDGLADLDIDYIAIVDAVRIERLVEAKGTVLLAAAAQVGATRLIDNVKYTIPDAGDRNASGLDSRYSLSV
ncbi:MAG: pantoate--beta-alanine ligase [Candidatus Hydrogenedentes bacterium]|jgi:pantoate--beta-alanine ligase|nr:pantoate--beta-alanine ligase [Candidatus Hydrogenedentota bacterium]